MLNGERVAVFDTPSMWRIRITTSPGAALLPDAPAKPDVVVAAYKGEIHVQPETGAIARITREAVDLPSKFPTHTSATVVDYRSVRIGSESYLCPIRSVTISDSDVLTRGMGARSVQHLNDIRFSRYRKFEAESRLVTGEAADSAVDGAPESSANEEPLLWAEPEAEEEPIKPEPVPASPSVAGKAASEEAPPQAPHVIHGARRRNAAADDSDRYAACRSTFDRA